MHDVDASRLPSSLDLAMWHGDCVFAFEPPKKGSGRAMGTMMASGTDVVSFLKEQHQQVKSLFETVLAAQGEERAKAFYSLRRMLAVHETAEEEIVHPAARRAFADGEAVVQARLNEENE